MGEGLSIMDMHDMSILVTGGTGSFGRKFVEIVLKNFNPRRLIVFSRDELKQHEMRQVFGDQPGSPLRYFIGDVRDKERLNRALVGVDMVIHAAALKQVPACEYNPFEAVKTNILGAQNIIEAAIDKGVRKVIAISTDKAVNPVNLYGATKLCAEKMFVQANAYSGATGTRFSVCRYGNVVGSRGSVIPLFVQQRKKGVVTITDRRMTRFWLTLDQGVRFVLKCLEVMQGGEIFVPKIPSMNIMDLAEAVAPGCRCDFIGIRPGEKLHEVLISEEEAYHTLDVGEMYVVRPLYAWWQTQNWSEGTPLPDGFHYASNNNDRWLGVDELRELLVKSGFVEKEEAGRK